MGFSYDMPKNLGIENTETGGSTDVAKLDYEPTLGIPSEPVGMAKPMFSSPILTYGQLLVAYKFNPSGLDKVNEIKKWFADQIDEIHALYSPNPAFSKIVDEAVGELMNACKLLVQVHTANK